MDQSQTDAATKVFDSLIVECLLSLHFAKKFADEAGDPAIGFSKIVRNILNSYSWPGNVRELKNLVERLTILHPKSVITEDQLPIE